MQPPAHPEFTSKNNIYKDHGSLWHVKASKLGGGGQEEPNWEPKMSKGSKENEGSEGDHFQQSAERARAPPPPLTEHPNTLGLQT